MKVETDMKTAYLEKLEARKEELGAELKKLESQVRAFQADAKIEYVELIDELEERKDRVKKKIRNLQDAGSDSWEELKEGAEEALSTLITSMTEAKERVESEMRKR